MLKLKGIAAGALLIISCFSGYGQHTIVEGSSFKIDQYKDLNLKVSTDGMLYAERWDEGGRGEKLHVDIFEPLTLNLQLTIHSDIELPKGQACISTAVTFINNEFTFFYTIDSKTENKFYIVFQKYTKTGEKIGTLKALYDLKRSGISGRPILKISNNNAYVLLPYDYETPSSTEYHFVVFDHTLKTLIDKKLEMNGSNIHSIPNITDNGDIVVKVKLFDKAYKIYSEAITVMAKNKNYEVKEQEMLNDMGIYVTSVDVTYDNNASRIFISGTYTKTQEKINVDESEGIFYLIYDISSGNFTTRKKIAYSDKLIKSIRQEDEKATNLDNIETLKTIYADGKLKLIMERRPLGLDDTGLHNTHIYDEVIIFTIGNDNPNVMSEQVISKYGQYFAKACWQPFWSAYVRLNGGNIEIFFNDLKSRDSMSPLVNKTDMVPKTDEQLVELSGVLKKATIAADNKITVENLFEYTKANQVNYFNLAGCTSGPKGELYWSFGKYNRDYRVLTLK